MAGSPGDGAVRGALIIRRPRARSSAGIKRSRTASCSSITTYPAILNARSPPSWRITTMPVSREPRQSSADVYFGRAEAVLLERERIKRQTIANRRLQHHLHAAKSQSQMIQSLPSASRQYAPNHLTTDSALITVVWRTGIEPPLWVALVLRCTIGA